jgi:hypothetical protein
VADGSAMVLADDTLTTARHAAEHGWIDPAALGEIGGEKRDDEGATAAKAGAPGADPGTHTPALVVERPGDLP